MTLNRYGFASDKKKPFTSVVNLYVYFALRKPDTYKYQRVYTMSYNDLYVYCKDMVSGDEFQLDIKTFEDLYVGAG